MEKIDKIETTIKPIVKKILIFFLGGAITTLGGYFTTFEISKINKNSSDKDSLIKSIGYMWNYIENDKANGDKRTIYLADSILDSRGLSQHEEDTTQQKVIPLNEIIITNPSMLKTKISSIKK